jgi:hypothetical protein
LLCNETTIKRVSGYDAYGDPIVTGYDTVSCKLEFKFRNITNKIGEEVVSEGQIRLQEKIGELDEVLINGVYRNFIQIQPQDDFSGKILYWIGWF